MRVLVAPDKFAGTLTASRRPRRSLRAGERQAPDDELDLAPMADGGPGFVDVLHAALGGELHVVTVEAVHGEPVPATILRVGDTAYVESAQACGLHLLDGPVGGGAELASTDGVGQLVLAAVDERCGDASWSGSAARAPTTGAPGCSPRWARPPTASSTAVRSASTTVTTVDLEPARRRLAGRGAGDGLRRRQPADRTLRRDQDLRSAEGDPRGPDRAGRRLAGAVRRRHRPPDVAGEGSRCGRWPRLRPALPGRAPGAGHRAGGRRRTAGRACRALPTSSSPARVPSTSPAVPARCPTAWRDRRARRCGRAWRWPVRCSSGRARCARWGWSRRTRWSTWWGRSGPSPTRPGSLADLAERVARTWSRP